MDDSSDGQTTREGSSMDQELCLVWLYCVIDGTLRSMIGTGRLRRRGPEPDLTDAEVLTLQIWVRCVDWRAMPRSGAKRQPICGDGSRAWARSGASCGGAATSRACRSGC